MTQDTIKLFSTIKPTLLRHLLLKGTLISGIGIFILLLGGAFIPVALLAYLGPFLLIIGGGLIIWGLLPYRKLFQIENNPHELAYVDDLYLQYIIKGKEVYTIPLQSIAKFEYIEKGEDYGIGIHLKKGDIQKIIVHDHRFNMAKQQNMSRKMYACDIFVPYFSRRSYTRIALSD